MNTEMSTRTYSRPHTNQPKDLIDIVKIDEYKQPRSRNEPYTELTDIQMQNLKKKTNHSTHFHISYPPVFDDTKHTMERHAKDMSSHLVRGMGNAGSYCYIDYPYSQVPDEEYNTCRDRASERWGPQKAGERTRSHLFGETRERYTNIDMYRRPPTNQPGKCVMSYGRPAGGYYSQRYPATTTWYGAGVELNKTDILDSIAPKTMAEYQQIKEEEQSLRATRVNEWPHYSEYTDKFVLRNKAPRKLTPLEEKKLHVSMAE